MESEKVLIVKLGAAGDVIRTTVLLHLFPNCEIHWLTNWVNAPLLRGIKRINEVYFWGQDEDIRSNDYDRIINLEDSIVVAKFLHSLPPIRFYHGAFPISGDRYTEDMAGWFNMSLISRFSPIKADELKLLNRKTYQDYLFYAFGREFKGEKYFLPEFEPPVKICSVGIVPTSGKVWPNKKWPYMNRLAKELRLAHISCTMLGKREHLIHHIMDVSMCEILVSGDTLPMHIGLGLGVHCLTLFTCTSPWEIYDYGVQEKIISPKLEKYFYSRKFNQEAVDAIPFEFVLQKVLEAI